MLNCWRWNKRYPVDSIKAGGAKALPLSAAEAGRRVKVCTITGGRSLCARMAAMGIYPGVEVELLCGGCGCPCLVKVGNGTLSLGVGESQKILVTPVG